MWSMLAGYLRQYAERSLLTVLESPGAVTARTYKGADLLAATDLAQDLSLPPESRVILLLLPHSPELFLLQIGLVLIGKIPAVLPWPTTRVDGEKYQRNLLYQLSNLSADHLITVPRLAENLRPLAGFGVTGLAVTNHASLDAMFGDRLSGVSALPPQLHELRAMPEDAVFLQFSGGTTGTQKCVVVTERMVEEQVICLRAVLESTAKDCVVSWLPLYHDMGLIACLYFPLLAGISSVHFAASDWLLKPELLFHFIETYQGSHCWLPNFAFSYLAQRKEMMSGEYSLHHVRRWINCSEPVRSKSFDEFARQFQAWGVRQESLHSSYAMAENVFAVTQSSGVHPVTTARSKVTGASAGYPPNAFELIDEVFVSSGRCLPGMSVRIIGQDGSLCEDLVAGEIHISSSCLFEGYWERGGFSRSSFAADGWYRSGDFGFLDRGELFVIGRIKDIIIVAGQNIFPEDVELLTAQVAGVQPGRVVAFGVDNDELGTQSVAVVAEMAGEFDPLRASRLEQEVRRLIIASLGIAPRHVSVVPQRWVVKSTAGKISRRDTRNRFLAGEAVAEAKEANVAGS
jgi:fatty-acyl-CoA synthase